MERASAGQLTRSPRASAAATAAALPSPAPSRTSRGARASLRSLQVPNPARAPGRGPAGPGGARHLGTPSNAQRGSAGPADGAAAAAAAARRAPLRPRPVRLSAELAPPPRQLSRSLPRPPVLPAHLRGLHASCPAEATSSGRGPLHTMAPGRTEEGAAVRARLVLAFALASVLSGPPAAACPTKCTCSAASVDCHGLGLRAVPRGIPRNAERL